MEYMLLLVGDEKADRQLPEEEQKRIIEEHFAFSDRLRADDAHVYGVALDASSTATTVDVAAGGAITDGPFAETAEQIGGIYFIRADDLDEAIEWAKQIPVSPGLRVEVRPVINM
ncbi:MAG TPA: YciI family protein [Nocardioidaceae bacterium]|nr:YciI family protein [Nocardioidaceae bacterium]